MQAQQAKDQLNSVDCTEKNNIQISLPVAWSIPVTSTFSELLTGFALISILFFTLHRYPPHGRRTMVIEEGVKWERLRAPPVDTPAHELHISDCLNDLRPGDHIEIQWRRSKENPYGVYYPHALNKIFDFLSSQRFQCKTKLAFMFF